MADLRPVYVAGDGDVKGPASSSNNFLPLFADTTGKLLKSSGTGVTTQGLAILDDNTPAEQRNTIGLDQVNNTSDVNKPVSTAQQRALHLKQDALYYTPVQQGGGIGQYNDKVHIGWNGANLKATVGTTDLGNIAFNLGSVDNTSDINKPVSTAQQTALNLKQDKLNYTPVQQGVGFGQGPNKVYIGWSNNDSNRLKATVDSTDLGNIVFDGNTATESVVGVAKIATSVHATAGVNDDSMMTALKVKQAIDFFAPTSVQQSLSGAASNLRMSTTGTNAYVSVSADGLVLEASPGIYRTFREVGVIASVSISGLGGLDSGTSASNTWYYVWIISNGVAVYPLVSLSSTAPTMPAGYTYKARVGAVRTDSTANKYPLSATQIGRKTQYKIAAGSNVTQFVKLVNANTGNVLVAVNVDPSIPPTAGLIKVLFGNSVGNVNIVRVAASSTITNMDNSVGGGLTYTNDGTAAVMQAEIILESRNIYFSSGAPQSFISVIGWEDNL